MDYQVIVGVEDEETSGHALRWTVAFVRGMAKPVRICAVRVMHPPPRSFLGLPPQVPPSADAERLQGAEGELRDFVRRSTGGGSSIDVDVAVVEGDPGQVLVELGREADLLAMGAPTGGRLRHLLRTSTSQAVIDAGVAPVVLVPRRESRDRGESVEA